jgi:hypothetical protein
MSPIFGSQPLQPPVPFAKRVHLSIAHSQPIIERTNLLLTLL